MAMTDAVRTILSYYEHEHAGTLNQLSRMMMHGALGGTGKMIILPVDQGFEHGPARSFAMNPPAYDPYYHYQLAIDAGLNAYAAPLGMLEAGARHFAGCIPTILKVNSANSLAPRTDHPTQAITASVQDALRLGCVAIGFTIYPGSGETYTMYEQISAMSYEAKQAGLAVIIWSYPRGGELSKDGETALDVCAYAAHMAALLGAHIIKVKLPSEHIEQKEARKAYEANKETFHTLAARVAHVKQACLGGRRLVIFSGGASKSQGDVLEDTRAIAQGGGDGSIIGRNAFQRPRAEALSLLQDMVAIYREYC
ncbi:MAG: class I fructose-bisphosphate aldolase [Alphaproteobacteria bacterium]|nr:MAG: class I fructose-bisphosphate aldolase [Alphaproteobacteria bacterium]TAF76647.1 MAG: class I fructose-bisphosphate aldolase [Alphaproteobacteria bacterium]